MTVPISVSGFPSSNRVPGAYGEVLTGQGGQGAASLPKKLLVVGLALSSGSILPDKQVVPIQSTVDADNAAGPGGEGATMLYDALEVAGNLGVPLYYASPAPAGGATAATTNLRFNGTATAAGAVIVRINGETISQGIAVGDTASVVAANLQLAVAGFGGGRLPITATNTGVYTILTSRTAGVRGMQHVVFLDVSQMPAGLTASLYKTWTVSTTWAVGDQVIPLAAPNGFYFKCTTGGAGSGTEPTWPTTIGTTVADGAATWTCWGNTATGNNPTTALFLGSGTGLETYTNLLATLNGAFYDRIALSANDATSLAAWKTQVDTLAAAPVNFLQQVIVAGNGSESASQSLAQTTLNDTRFEFVWQQNSETHTSRIAAAMAGIRTLAETTNPNAGYDGVVLSTVTAQSQIADVPQLPVKIIAVNNSLTALDSPGDGTSTVVRAITTKSITGGAADYGTLDTAAITVPDFVLTDLKLYWSSVLRTANPVSSDDIQGKQPPSGVLTPSRVVAAFNSKMVGYSNGILTSTPLPGAQATVPPIVIAPNPGDISAMFDPIAKRIMAAVNVNVMPLDHQIGVIVAAQ